MRPKIILHVGTEKTGSTSIQNMLKGSYDVLLESGVLFPKSIGLPCNINLTACALEDKPNHPIRGLLGLQEGGVYSKYVSETKRALREEIKRTSPSVIIISDEHINAHLSTVESLLLYKSICEEYGDIESVIIYLRQQDEFRLSIFSEAVKAGNLTKIDLEDLLPVFDVIPYRLNYLSVLDNLSEAFGKNLIIPRIYDREKFPGRDICADFLNVTGIELTLEGLEEREKNKTVDAKIIRHLALISSSLKGFNTPWAEKLRQKIIQICEKIFTGPGPILQKEAHMRFLDQFEKQNKILSDKYFRTGNSKGALFPNHYLKERSKKPIYPDCTISWSAFFIEFARQALFEELETGAKNEREVGESVLTGPKEEILQNKEREGVVEANCPVCGAHYMLDVSLNSREGKLCTKCGASGRAQAIAYSISTILLGKVVPLNNHAKDKTKRILGLSDGRVYAEILNKKYNYTNTFYHRDPFLDITKPSAEYIESADILITTEVFEHIVGPSLAAFRGAFDVLKPGGYMILTVPFVNKGDSIEHYDADLKQYTSYKKEDGSWVAELEFDDGRKEIELNPKFHGGPGKTLEIRLFNRERLIDELGVAGFEEVVFHDENIPKYGINWSAASRVITARKPLLHKSQ